jgi:transposase
MERGYAMRREDPQNPPAFYFLDIEGMIPAHHPLRKIRAMTDQALLEMKWDLDQLYQENGRPCIPPEMLLRALLLQYLFSVRSERLLMEQLEYNLLFRWFVGLAPQERVWDHSTFSKNRKRFLDGDLARKFLLATVRQATAKGLVSDEHFSVDGTLVDAWASLKSIKPVKEQENTRRNDPPPPDPGNPSIDFRGETRRNETHRSTTDPESRLIRKGKGMQAKLSYMGNTLMEHRNGIAMDGDLRIAENNAERNGCLDMLRRKQEGRTKSISVSGDKWFDETKFIQECRRLNIVPHIAVKDQRGSKLVDGRTTRHTGYRTSLVLRKRIEEIFGWVKEPGRMRRVKVRGAARVSWFYLLALGIYNLVRMSNLEATADT